MSRHSLHSPWVQSLLAALAGLLLALPLAAWAGAGGFFGSWLAFGLLLAPGLALMRLAWQAAGGGRALAAMMLSALLARLLLGAFFTSALPSLGYPGNAEHSAGYFFSDAYNRDGQAWNLALSGESLGAAFSREMVSDQYGGLLSLSALAYRLLSPDAHRQYMVIILGALAAALGVPFLWAVAARRWGRRVALFSGWLLALYPESVLLGAGQMREPFLIALVAAMFWATCSWNCRKRPAGIVFALSLVGMLLISSRVALIAAGVCLGWFLLEQTGQKARGGFRLGWLTLAAAGLLLVALSWGWLAEAARWDVRLTVEASGWVQRVLNLLPDWLDMPFVVGYGLAQPVFPASLADLVAPWIAAEEAVFESVAPLLVRVVGVARSAGWYLLVPFLIYALFAVWQADDRRERRLLVWLALAMLFWVLLSSARAGGDQWDNPRYRTIFLPWLALLAGWGWAHARARKDAWLGRSALVFGIFTFFFAEWYLSRYTRLFHRFDFFVMVAIIIALSLVVIVAGVLIDRRKRRGLTQPPESL
jgi:hypothetical protein